MKEFSILNYVDSWLDTNVQQPENEPGVYFIYSKTSLKIPCIWLELVYIGSSSNLKRRLCSHPVIKRMESDFGRGCCRVVYFNTADFRLLEKEAIRRFSPLINIHHNG